MRTRLTNRTFEFEARLEARRQVAEVDRALVEAAQRGDQAAFIDLIRPRTPRLLAIAFRVIGDHELAEDAVQDALVLAWRDLKGLRDPDRFDAWLHRLVVNQCIRQAKRERRRTSALRGVPTPGAGAGPDEFGAVALRDQLERGFERLSPEQRAALVLHHFAGYSLAELAETLSIPPGTARSRLHYAHVAMRAALEADARMGHIVGAPE
jgi:RNA polymerase sigma-70 factor, ECF subfamily